MDDYAKKMVLMAIVMILCFIALVVVYVKSGYDNAVAVVGFFVILGIIGLCSYLSDYGDYELARMDVKEESIEASKNPLVEEDICQTCGRPITFEKGDCCPYCGAAIKK